MKKVNINYLIITTSVIISLLLFFGCDDKENIPKKEDNSEPREEEEWAEWTEGHTVYVAGFESVNGARVARLWKNGIVQNLESSVDINTFSGIVSSVANSVFAYNNDVYVAGFEEIVKYGEISYHSRLWKNGEILNLTNGNFYEEAISVFVSKGDVYVLGHEMLGPIQDFGWAFKVWKNGEVEIFDEGYQKCEVNSLFVANDTVYVVGCKTKRSELRLQATIWKNGIAEDLISESHDTSANSIFIANDTVYVTGNTVEGIEKPNPNFAKLWKNGKEENIKFSSVNTVHVSGNDVYLVGRNGDMPILLKNGIMQNISNENYFSFFALDNDVYLAGYNDSCSNIVEHQNGEVHMHYGKAALWKNGKKLNLQIGEKGSIAWSVFVKYF